eukprot:2372700-Amphidinium_carterae.1
MVAEPSLPSLGPSLHSQPFGVLAPPPSQTGRTTKLRKSVRVLRKRRKKDISIVVVILPFH